ncbi:MAG TPA: mannosyltransferase family protein [Propionibacteriaceae bacterium]|nr:mannosyltransferase family protein [Propionibacteriaceae bacterium]
MVQHVVPQRDGAAPDSTETPAPARTVVQAWLASRGLIFAVALVLAVVQHRTLTNMVSNWDVQHFARLAAEGYRAEPDGTLMAFFPGWPAILWLFEQLGIPIAISGVMISTACSAVAAAALYRLGGRWAAVAWLFAPTAVFTVVPYTESLFCAAAFWAWERARADRWLAATMLTALACTVRVSGLFLIGALLVMIMTSASGGKLRRAALMLIPAAVITTFAIYLYTLAGTWTAWYRAQSTGWVRELTWPWDSFLNTIPAILPGAYANHPWWAAVFRGEMISMAVGVGVTIWCIVVSLRARKSPGSDRTMWGEASWVGVQVLAFSVSYWFFSVNRATLLWFPLWIMIGRWVAGSSVKGRWHRVLVASAFGIEIVLMLWWSWLFFTGHWAS